MSSESRSQTALASLHATYTDSEGDPDSDIEETNRDRIHSPSKESTPSSIDDRYFKERNASKLVSYTTEAYGHASDSDKSFSSSSDMQEDSQEGKVRAAEDPPLSPVSFHRSLLNLKKQEVHLPAKPIGRCSNSLQEKISELYEKKQQGKDMNASIQKRKDFRNPSIYEKLITYCDIDEQGTNYPPEIFDPHSWGPESFYEELAKRQKEEMDKREKEKKERTKVEFMSGTVKKSSSESTNGLVKKTVKKPIGRKQVIHLDWK